MFQLSSEEMIHLGGYEKRHGGNRIRPVVFTENGVAMLSSVLGSERAIQINIAIIRTFTRLRSFLLMESALHERAGELEQNTHAVFKIIFERLDSIEDVLNPVHPAKRNKIGIKK